MSRLRHCWPVSLTALLCLLTFFAGAKHAQCQDTFSANSVRYELALTLKTAADERFLQNNPTKAEALYAEASKQADLIPSDSDDVNSTFLVLLKTDIKYRQSLLEHGLEFWGSTYSQTPAIPVQEFTYFGDYFKTFDQSLKDMDQDLKDASGVKTTIQSFDALAQGTDTSADVSALQKGKAELASNYYDGQLGLLQIEFRKTLTDRKKLPSRRNPFLAKQPQNDKHWIA